MHHSHKLTQFHYFHKISFVSNICDMRVLYVTASQGPNVTYSILFSIKWLLQSFYVVIVLRFIMPWYLSMYDFQEIFSKVLSTETNSISNVRTIRDSFIYYTINLSTHVVVFVMYMSKCWKFRHKK